MHHYLAQQRVLVDGPNAVRGPALIKNLRLTDMSVSIKRNSSRTRHRKLISD